jgi:hypothetical protein
MSSNNVPNVFWEWTATLKPDDRAGLLFAVIAAAVGVIAIIVTAIYRTHRNRLEIAFKREMLDRGMSADEIATVMAQPKQSMPCGSRRDRT